jgi:hypothetical protein
MYNRVVRAGATRQARPAWDALVPETARRSRERVTLLLWFPLPDMHLFSPAAFTQPPLSILFPPRHTHASPRRAPENGLHLPGMTSMSPERRSRSDRTVQSTLGAWLIALPHSSGTVATTCSPWSSAISKPPVVSRGGAVTGMPGTLARAERTCPRPSTPVISMQPTLSLTEREIAHMSFAVSVRDDVHPTVWSEHVRPP